ncbi:MAG: hypothetical protein K2X48_05760 [Chitinophagaceae bacterium]|nr:hypothetical protein [Chitinophagaceae bacterium]
MIGISSCDVCSCKKVTCAAFNDELFNQWLPYRENQQLIFKTTAGIADTIRISAVRKSEAYEGRTGGGFGCGKGCFADVSITGTDAGGTDFQKLQVYATKSDAKGDGTGVLSNLDVHSGSYNSRFYAGTLRDTGFAVIENQRKASTLFSSSLNIASRTFANVQTITLDTASFKLPGVYKYYFAKGSGIVAWESYPDKTLWIKE